MNNKKEVVDNLATAFFSFKRLNQQQCNNNKTKKSENMLLMALVHMTRAGIEDIKISDLSSKFHMTPAAATHLINSLEEGNLLIRVQHPTDRRIVIVKPTEEGVKKSEDIKNQITKEFEMLFDYLGEKDSMELTRLLTVSYDFFRGRVENCEKSCKSRE